MNALKFPILDAITFPVLLQIQVLQDKISQFSGFKRNKKSCNAMRDSKVDGVFSNISLLTKMFSQGYQFFVSN